MPGDPEDLFDRLGPRTRKFLLDVATPERLFTKRAQTDATGGLGRLIRNRRIAAGLTVRELCDRSGVSERAIIDIENGRTQNPQPRNQKALADTLGISLTQISACILHVFRTNSASKNGANRRMLTLESDKQHAKSNDNRAQVRQRSRRSATDGF